MCEDLVGNVTVEALRRLPDYKIERLIELEDPQELFDEIINSGDDNLAFVGHLTDLAGAFLARMCSRAFCPDHQRERKVIVDFIRWSMTFGDAEEEDFATSLR